MNQKELNELRRRFRPDKNAISRIYGCYVNGAREIVAEIDTSLGTMPEEEAEQYLNLLKKALSGGLGRSLTDIVFSTQQVMDSDEHRLLSALRDSELKDPEIRQEFYRKAIDALDLEDNNCLILLAHDRYDVPFRGRDGSTQADASEQVFSYILCCVCPVKDTKPHLHYDPQERTFRNRSAGQMVSPPELGFLFPAFDDRSANIYNALFYSRSTAERHQPFVDAVFHTEAPMAPEEQREAFQEVLCEALGQERSFELVQSVHQQLQDRILQHKESRDPEPLDLSIHEVSRVLENSGAGEEQVETFRDLCGQSFGDGAVLRPENIIDSKKFQLRTPEVTVTVDPESSALVETRLIQGRKYILIPAENGVEVNGVSVEIR